MRFAIWSGKSTGITMPTSMEKARHIIDVRNGWRTTLGNLQSRLDWNSKGAGNQITKLEINCHGAPGKLLLPDVYVGGLVDHNSVTEFGALLRPHLAPGAMIELLACSVASIEFYFAVDAHGAFTGPYDSAQPTAHYSASILREYWGAYMREAGAIDSNGQMVLSTGATAKRTHDMIAIGRKYEWGPEGNGLRFCLALAAASGGIVRASDVIQYETDKTNHKKLAVDAIGNWEGHVWDFKPDGDVKYRGINLQRSQGHIAFSGDEGLAQVGRQPMDGSTEDSPLRGQRLNRAPLAV